MPHHNLSHFESRNKRGHRFLRTLLSSSLLFLTADRWLLGTVLTWVVATMAPHAVTGQEIQSVLDGPILNAAGQAIVADDVPDFIENSRPNEESKPAEDEELGNVDAGEKIDALITKIVLNNIPHEFNEDKDWGAQEPRWNGVNIRREGLKIRTNRKKKMVNHGTWKKYDVSLLKPEDQFSISVKNMREAEDGKMAFDVYIAANLKIDGRQAKWVKGVQLYNVSIDGKTKVNVKATIELRTLMDVTKFPPDLIFRPEATAAEIVIEDFRIDRISKVGGEVAQQITRIARDAIGKRLKNEEEKTVNKLNGEFSKNADNLRLSLHDAMSNKWSEAAKKFMPENVKQALEE